MKIKLKIKPSKKLKIKVKSKPQKLDENKTLKKLGFNARCCIAQTTSAQLPLQTWQVRSQLNIFKSNKSENQVQLCFWKLLLDPFGKTLQANLLIHSNFSFCMFVFKIFLLWVVSKSVFRSWRFSQLLIRSKLAVANKILVQVGVNVRPEFRLRRKWWYNGGKDFGHECIRYMPRILSKSKSVRWTQRFYRFFLSFIKRVLLAFDFSALLVKAQ